MRGSIKRLATMGITALVLTTSLGIIGAAPAGAEDGYTPDLAAAPAGTELKFGDDAEPAAALTAANPKRLARIEAAQAKAPARAASVKRGGGESDRAQQLLNGYIRKYPILRGTTVSFGDARGYQAIAYYQSGRIVISKNHSASLERIIGHEIWHVIDWRDNGRIDWGENVPPK